MSGSSTNAIATSIQRNATRGFAPAGCGRRLLRVGLQAEVSISWMCISVPWVPGKRNMAEPDQAAFWNARYAANEYLFGTRSEEHTSELQSLMRISYAVFCLKKKKTT